MQQVIVGGIKVAHDYHPSPRPETTQDILTRALKLCPELIPPSEVSATDKSESIDIDLIKPLIIEEGCGLRPAREGGVRIEAEWIELNVVNASKRIPLVHNYGHSGSGYQSSWGSAHRATKLLDKALGK